MTCHWHSPMFCKHPDDGPLFRRIAYTSPATCNVVSRLFCDHHSRIYWMGLTPELRAIASHQNVGVAA